MILGMKRRTLPQTQASRSSGNKSEQKSDSNKSDNKSGKGYSNSKQKNNHSGSTQGKGSTSKQKKSTTPNLLKTQERQKANSTGMSVPS